MFAWFFFVVARIVGKLDCDPYNRGGLEKSWCENVTVDHDVTEFDAEIQGGFLYALKGDDRSNLGAVILQKFSYLLNLLPEITEIRIASKERNARIFVALTVRLSSAARLTSMPDAIRPELD
ncbi:MAG: hypothetical protein KDN20_25175 [Verrucomicrobiae bacterium]|nr:hypothetical protein [Verrucomicrobiae bacterium]